MLLFSIKEINGNDNGKHAETLTVFMLQYKQDQIFL